MKEILNSYGIIKYNSGIYELIFNTKEKWVMYDRNNNEEYQFENEIIKIDKFLPNERFIISEWQNEDTISYYFIPYNLVNLNDNQIIKFERYGY